MIEKDISVGIGFCDSCLIRIFEDEHVFYRFDIKIGKKYLICDDCAEKETEGEVLHLWL